MTTSPRFHIVATATLLFILQIKIPETAGKGQGKAGDPCSSHVDCDQLNLLACNSRSMTCQCVVISTLPLLYFKGQCVSYVGGACSFIRSKDGPNINCVEHGMCVKVGNDNQETNGKCFCKDGYFRTSSSVCVKNQPLPNSNALSGGIEVPENTKGSETQKQHQHHHTSKYPEPYPRSMSALAAAPSSLQTTFTFLLIMLYGIVDVFN